MFLLEQQVSGSPSYLPCVLGRQSPFIPQSPGWALGRRDKELFSLPPRMAEQGEAQQYRQWEQLSHGRQRPQACGTTSAWGAGSGSTTEAVELVPEGQGGAPRQARGKWPQQRQLAWPMGQ